MTQSANQQMLTQLKRCTAVDGDWAYFERKDGGRARLPWARVAECDKDLTVMGVTKSLVSDAIERRQRAGTYVSDRGIEVPALVPAAMGS